MNPRDLVLGIVVPGLVGGLILLFAWKLTAATSRRNASAPAPAAAVAVSLATLAGFGLLFGWNPQPGESWLWIFWVFPAAAVLGGLEARANNSLLVSSLLRIALVSLAVGLVFRKTLLPTGGALDQERLVLFMAIPLISISVWKAIFPIQNALVGSIALWMIATAIAAMLLFANSLKFAQIGGALAGALGALVVACVLRPSASGMLGAITPVAVILSTLVCLSFEYASPAYSPWLLALVALAPALGLVPGVSTPWKKLALIAIPIAVAVALAFRTYDTSAL